MLRFSSLSRRPKQGVYDELNRREPLLSIDNLLDRNLSEVCFPLGQYERSHVMGIIARAAQHLICLVLDVRPQWFPLLFTFPFIMSLVHGYAKTGAVFQELTDGTGFSFPYSISLLVD